MDLRMTWRDPRTAIVHEVEARNVKRGPDGYGHAEHLKTVCGLDPHVVNRHGDGPVTCQLCLEADWFGLITVPVGLPEREGVKV